MASRSKTRQKSPPKLTPNEKILEKMQENASKPTPKSPPKSPPKLTPNEKILEKMQEKAPKPTPTTPSSTAQVPKGGAALSTQGNSAMASLARSLFKGGVGRLIPGAGLILTAVEVARYLKDVDMGETDASKHANYGGQIGRGRREKENKEESSQERAKRITRDEPFGIKELDTELRMREDLKNPRNVLPAPGSKLKDKGPASSEPPVPRNRPSTVDTQSKKPLAKRIMEALGDKRTMEQATRDRKMTEEMEMEREMNVAGRKKGGMAKKKKAPVKKAYGGMVKKKHGGSANKVNMKAGFTRRGCSKG
jgi:hypothetical protein